MVHIPRRHISWQAALLWKPWVSVGFVPFIWFHLYIFLLKIYEDLQTLRIKEDLIAQESSFVLEALDLGLTLASSSACDANLKQKHNNPWYEHLIKLCNYVSNILKELHWVFLRRNFLVQFSCLVIELLACGASDLRTAGSNSHVFSCLRMS